MGIEEPYFLLEEEGYLFSDPPGIDDFIEQFNRSIKLIKQSSENTLFDRGPWDFLAYILAVSKGFDIDPFIEPMKQSLKYVDSIIFMPLEYPDRIYLPTDENKKLRSRVDEVLHEILLDNSLGVDGYRVIEAKGKIEERVNGVLSEIF